MGKLAYFILVGNCFEPIPHSVGLVTLRFASKEQLAWRRPSS